VTKHARNAPCPCGSGRKYKKCCLPQDDVKERAEAYARREREAATRRPVVFQAGSDDHLDELSNSVIDLVNAGDIDAALEVCRELKELFPNMPDGAMRQAEVHKARNEYTEAAEELMAALAIMRSDEGAHDEEFIQSLQHEAERLRERNG